MGSCNNNAGGRILDHYEEEWERIHKVSVENSHLAECVASCICGIAGSVERDTRLLVHLESDLTLFTSNDSLIHALQITLDQLLVNVKLVEGFLREKEEMSVRQRMNKALDMDYHVRIYEGKVRKELDARMRVVQNEHTLRMRELVKEKARREEERRKREEELLLERQRTFSEAFQSEIDQYRRQGVINRPINNPVSPSPSLSEVVLQVDEEEKRMLEQFLQDED